MRVSLRGLLGACLCAGAIRSRASLWESSGWALTSNADAALGYDSNLTLSEKNVSSSYASLRPYLLLQRRNSGSLVEFRGSVQETVFNSASLERQTDLFLTGNYAYPYSDDRLPRTTAAFSWSRATQADSWAAGRIKTEVADASFNSRLFNTGKLGLTVGFSGNRTEFLSLDNNLNQGLSGSLGLAYEKTPLTILSLNVGYGLGESNYGSSERLKVRSDSYSLFSKIEGELLPKIRGNVQAGAAHINYRGSYSATASMPIAGIGTTWDATSRGSLSLNGLLGAGFSPGGQRSRVVSLSVNYQQAVFEEWSSFARLDFNQNTYFNTSSSQRLDRAYKYSAGIAYDPSKRLSARITLGYGKQDSEERIFQYKDYLTEISCNYRF